jgi:hypothetical protein
MLCARGPETLMDLRLHREVSRPTCVYMNSQYAHNTCVSGASSSMTVTSDGWECCFWERVPEVLRSHEEHS